MKMGITLLIVGVIVAISGIVLICCNRNKTSEESKEATVQVQEVQEVQKPAESKKTNKEKGNDFEGYIADVLAENGITIKEWNQGAISSGGNMAGNALNPDFFVSQPSEPTPLEYWVESKWRKDCPETFAIKETQFDRYRQIQRESKRKIIIAVGIGGSPSAPKSVYFVPLDSLKEGKISVDEMRHFYLSNPGRDFRGRMQRWFRNEVFNKKK